MSRNRLTSVRWLRSKNVLDHRSRQREEKKAECKQIDIGDLRNQTYQSCLYSGSFDFNVMRRIESQNYELYCCSLNIISLSAHDDIRYLLVDGISSYAYDRYRISDQE